MEGSEEPIARGYDRANVKAESAQYCTQLQRFIIERRICFIQKLLFRLDQITGKYGKTSMLGAIQFDFPIRRPNYRFVNEAIFSAVIGTLVPADGAGVVRASVDVNHIGHNANYTAHLGGRKAAMIWESLHTNLTCPVCALIRSSQADGDDYIGDSHFAIS